VRLRSDDVTWREVDGQIVVLDLRRSVFLETNRSGSALWRALAAGPMTVDELAETLRTAHGLDDEVSMRDAKGFVEMLHHADLLET
jgi:hypothetical protein